MLFRYDAAQNYMTYPSCKIDIVQGILGTQVRKQVKQIPMQGGVCINMTRNAWDISSDNLYLSELKKRNARLCVLSMQVHASARVSRRAHKQRPLVGGNSCQY